MRAPDPRNAAGPMWEVGPNVHWTDRPKVEVVVELNRGLVIDHLLTQLL